MSGKSKTIENMSAVGLDNFKFFWYKWINIRGVWEREREREREKEDRFKIFCQC
jgi:hypothetical protein